MFPYINSEQSNIKKTILFKIVLKRIKHLRVHLTKEVKDLYNENYTILMKESEERLGRCKDSLFSWIGRFSIIIMAILSKVR